MRPALSVDGDDVGARFGESGDIGIDRRNHQMHVERERRMRPQRGDDARPEGDVGHEMPVHHIEMNPVGAGLRHRARLLAQPREIGRENRGRDDDAIRHDAYSAAFLLANCGSSAPLA